MFLFVDSEILRQLEAAQLVGIGQLVAEVLELRLEVSRLRSECDKAHTIKEFKWEAEHKVDKAHTRKEFKWEADMVYEDVAKEFKGGSWDVNEDGDKCVNKAEDVQGGMSEAEQDGDSTRKVHTMKEFKWEEDRVSGDTENDGECAEKAEHVVDKAEDDEDKAEHDVDKAEDDVSEEQDEHDVSKLDGGAETKFTMKGLEWLQEQARKWWKPKKKKLFEYGDEEEPPARAKCRAWSDFLYVFKKCVEHGKDVKEFMEVMDGLACEVAEDDEHYWIFEDCEAEDVRGLYECFMLRGRSSYIKAATVAEAEKKLKRKLRKLRR